MPALKHVHKYQRIALWITLKRPEGVPAFKCMRDGCSSYTTDIEAVLGNKTICWGCEREIIMTRENLARTKPVCELCREERKEQREEMKSIPLRGE